MTPTLTAVVITKNEEQMIVNCLQCLQWCTKVVVVDQGSEDRTVELAKAQGADVISQPFVSFAQVRNSVLSSISTDWVMYIDADERVTPKLSQEILVQIETTTADVLAFNRQNIMFGQEFRYGGWTEHVPRVFRSATFTGWTGEIHESPTLSSAPVVLHAPLVHFTHRNTLDGLEKTLHWTPIEAKLLAESGGPVSWKTVIRKGVMEVWRRAVWRQGYKDGPAGVMEALIQGINRMLVYIQVWEYQQTPPIKDVYRIHEHAVQQLWKKHT